MCHEIIDRAWNRETESHDKDDTPEFLNEESDDFEVLTDGGED